MNLTIDTIASHRNGIAGEPFHVVFFRDHQAVADTLVRAARAAREAL